MVGWGTQHLERTWEPTYYNKPISSGCRTSREHLESKTFNTFAFPFIQLVEFHFKRVSMSMDYSIMNVKVKGSFAICVHDY